MVRFHTPISLLKLYVSVRGNQPTLIHAVVNYLGSVVVDKYTVPLLNNLCHVSELGKLTLFQFQVTFNSFNIKVVFLKLLKSGNKGSRNMR